LKTIDQVIQTVKRPERILQYGEGNFLRGFADWQIDILNERTGFNGNVVAVQPRNREGAQGELINSQRGLYTTVLRGLAGGKKAEEFRAIRSLSRCINPYTSFDEYFACAENPELRFVFSNTTEAGISYREGEEPRDRPQLSFPGKVTAFLHRRYEYFRGDPSKALILIPCELIDRNGEALRRIVERHAAAWKLGEDFTRWLGACVFCNTLVDRIVSGFPAEEAEALWEKLGYQDRLLTAGELFYLWVIEKPKTPPGVPPWDYRRELPLEEAGLNVVWTDDLEFYRTRKVRILNGAHSSTALAAFLYGLDTVDQCAADPTARRFMERVIFDEVIPSIGPDNGAAGDGTGDGALVRFARETLERFANPFIKHQLLSISLNGVSKFKTRVLPSILSCQKKYGRAPGALCCSLAALIVFYRGVKTAGGEMEGCRIINGEKLRYPIRDDGETLRRFAELWATVDKAPDSVRAAPPDLPDSPAIRELVHRALSCRELWGEDLGVYPALEDAVRAALETILRDGIGAALARAAERPVLFHIHPADNVAAALRDLRGGEELPLNGTVLTAREDIPRGHKIALRDIGAGEKVFKYGLPIGAASTPLRAGSWVHTHNLRTLLTEDPVYTWREVKTAVPAVPAGPPASRAPHFSVYRRPDGQTGVRNEIWIIPTVGCVNQTALALARWANAEFCGPAARNGHNEHDRHNGHIDGVYAWTHPYGCSQLGEDHEATRKILGGLARHPNAAAVLVLSLGCENNTLESFKELLDPYAEDAGRMAFLSCQDCGDEIAEGKRRLARLAEYARMARREDAGPEGLVLGLKCGGSDGLSGITANALTGRICDAFCGWGAAAILTEVPEIFGAERILLDRCENREIFNRAVAVIENFKDYYRSQGQVIYENPSPGNKAGGISTLEEKSCGCVQKGGLSPVRGVCRYGEQARGPGLTLLEGPGNDMVSTTALAAAGAQLILFTTGRGTPLGSPVPVIKIASNAELARRKPGWIDFDAGRLLTEDGNQVQAELLRLIAAVVSGRAKTRSEEHGYREIAIFKNGITL
jgi:altronate hydrolase